ncbi:MAG: hypothetical protein V3V08_11215 [Nannocystaceae bacterium]
MFQIGAKEQPGSESRDRSSRSVVELVANEIDEWYRDFYLWSRGLCSPDKGNIRPIYDVLARDFRVVLTSGDTLDKQDYWSRLVGLYGIRRGHPPSNIVNLSLRPVEAEHVLATFDLLKQGIRKKKVDSALFRRSSESRSGVVWVYVHESGHEIDAFPELASMPRVLGPDGAGGDL